MVRSAPPQNASLPDVSTAPLMAASVATRSAIAASSSVTFSSMTFIERPGMFQVTSAMPSASISKVKFWKVIRVSRRRLISSRPCGQQITMNRACRPYACSVLPRHRGRSACPRRDIRRARVSSACRFRDRPRRGPIVDQMMAVRHVGLEAGGIAGLEQRLAAVLDQNHFAFEDIDQLVFLFMPVPQRRRGARLERRQVDAELVETGRDCRAAFASGRRPPD